jgi:hypothetical protein
MEFGCDGCGCDPIMTQRWHCDVCQDFDFCDDCYNGRYIHDHSMSAISAPHGFERALNELMKRDPHFNFNLWRSQQIQ